MKKTFKSKIDLLLLLPVLLVLIGVGVYMALNGILAGEIAVGLVLLFVLYTCWDTFYMFTNDNKLKIKSGFFYNREIYIKSIRKITPTKNRRASPALSSDRLEISYNRYGRVVVSPNRKSEFIKDLKEVNPRIRIEEKR
ncbi:MAG: PH domain-containing protein [Flavisolibacter sp.]